MLALTLHHAKWKFNLYRQTHVFTFLKSTLAKEIAYLAAELRGPQLSLIQCFEPLSHLIDCLLVPFQDLNDDMLLRLSQLLF